VPGGQLPCITGTRATARAAETPPPPPRAPPSEGVPVMRVRLLDGGLFGPCRIGFGGPPAPGEPTPPRVFAPPRASTGSRTMFTPAGSPNPPAATPVPVARPAPGGRARTPVPAWRPRDPRGELDDRAAPTRGPWLMCAHSDPPRGSGPYDGPGRLPNADFLARGRSTDERCRLAASSAPPGGQRRGWVARPHEADDVKAGT